MRYIFQICLGLIRLAAAVAVIAAVTIASVIGIKTLYQHLYPAAETVYSSEFQIGDTIEDVAGFTSQQQEFTKQIGR
ncbi:MAG: hypothetical protein LUF00_03650 [Lachnospiraceae bacterium]|nr:hypothetical protein [Lachnospiraceae bacterium]